MSNSTISGEVPMHAKARACADVALTKYWGKKDEVLRLPENGSISMGLDALVTTIDLQLHIDGTPSSLTINGKLQEAKLPRVANHVERIAQLAVQRGTLDGKTAKKVTATVRSHNSFPPSTGLSSSGSSMAALTLAATHALGLELSSKELSILARQASGTACRCMIGGFIEWLDGDTSETSYSIQLHAPDYWNIRDVIAIVDQSAKLVSSTEGHTAAQSSPFFQTRLQKLPAKMAAVRQALRDKDFAQLGELVEAEALEFHSILLTSQPSYIAWKPGTIDVMLAVQHMRREGTPAYFTINTGFNIHVLTLPEHQDVVQRHLRQLSTVQDVILSGVGGAPVLMHD